RIAPTSNGREMSISYHPDVDSLSSTCPPFSRIIVKVVSFVNQLPRRSSGSRVMTDTQKTSRRAATANRASTFTESVIREMTRVANQYGAINLAQGFPDFPMPEPMKDAACAAIHGDINQYAITWGSPAL